jgi:GNAT superfamily N-acetyltransferase
VADGAGRVVGFASVGGVIAEQSEPEDVGELYTIYVAPDVWGQGVGRALMAAALLRLRNEGFGSAILWVLSDNPRTRRFYELAGWSHDGGAKEGEWLGTRVREVRYRTLLNP